MKKTLTALMLAVVMCLTLSAPAFAADVSEPYTSLSENLKVYYVDGVKITAGILPASAARGGTIMEGVRLTGSITLTYDCTTDLGSNLSARVDCVGDNNLKVTFYAEWTDSTTNKTHTFTSDPFIAEKDGDYAFFSMESESGANLDAVLDTTISVANYKTSYYDYQVNHW